MANLDNVYDVDDRYLAFESHEDGLLVSLAGPGTGKTHWFLRRIRSLTTDKDAELAKIAYITFNKEISNAFIADYEDHLPPSQDGSQRPRNPTLHSFACRLIRNRGFSIGLDGPLYFASFADPYAVPSKVFLLDLLPLVTHLSFTTMPSLRTALETIEDTWRKDKQPEDLDEPIPSLLVISLQLGH